MLWRAIERTQIPAVKEPPRLLISDGKSRDGATVIPWAKEKLMAWGVTVPDNFTESHLSSTAAEQGAAHIFFPIDIETAEKLPACFR